MLRCTMNADHDNNEMRLNGEKSGEAHNILDDMTTSESYILKKDSIARSTSNVSINHY